MGKPVETHSVEIGPVKNEYSIKCSCGRSANVATRNEAYVRGHQHIVNVGIGNPSVI